mgnify:CR=1 FL=1
MSRSYPKKTRSLAIRLVTAEGCLRTSATISSSCLTSLFTYKATVGDDEIRKGETEAKENHTGAIVGFSTLLVDTDDPEEKKQFVEIIQKNNELLLQLISDVLDLAKIESGIIELKLVEVDLRELCKELVVSMRIKVPAEVALCVVPDLPSYIMRCDKVRLTQIISNFINNAIKHTSKGTILLGYEIRLG